MEIQVQKKVIELTTLGLTIKKGEKILLLAQILTKANISFTLNYITDVKQNCKQSELFQNITKNVKKYKQRLGRQLKQKNASASTTASIKRTIGNNTSVSTMASSSIL